MPSNLLVYQDVIRNHFIAVFLEQNNSSRFPSTTIMVQVLDYFSSVARGFNLMGWSLNPGFVFVPWFLSFFFFFF